MNAIELRIGNLVLHNKNVISISPTALKEYFFIGDTYVDSKTDNRNCQPILLTEEWLLKFGFNIKEEIWFSKKTNIAWIRFEVSIKDKRCILYDTKGIIYCDMLFPKSVHQLQNLYFALTGEELTK